jgi:hypothetical protein
MQSASSLTVYTGTFHNDFCASEHSISTAIGGLALDQNVYQFPVEWVEVLQSASSVKQADLRLAISFSVSLETLMKYPKLQDYFKNSYHCDRIPLKALPGMQDRRPAPVSYALFPVVAGKIGELGGWDNFSIEVTQADPPIVEVRGVLSESRLLDEVLKAMGY